MAGYPGVVNQGDKINLSNHIVLGDLFKATRSDQEAYFLYLKDFKSMAAPTFTLVACAIRLPAIAW